jgi:putative FmdB family regulatory protein
MSVPTYDYRCDRCERTFEVRQRISDEPLTTCDRCGGPIRRLLAAAPFILKGGGWYVTDYPSEGRKKGIEAEKKAGGDGSETKSGDGASAAKPGTSDAAGSSSSAAPASDGGASKTTPAATN